MQEMCSEIEIEYLGSSETKLKHIKFVSSTFNFYPVHKMFQKKGQKRVLVECNHQNDPQTGLRRNFDFLLSDVTQYCNASVKQVKFVPLIGFGKGNKDKHVLDVNWD